MIATFLSYILFEILTDKVVQITLNLIPIRAGRGIAFQHYKTFPIIWAIQMDGEIKSLKDLKQHFKNKYPLYPELRSKVIQIFGRYYLNEMQGEELNMKWNRAFTEVQDVIKNEKDVANLMVKLGQTFFPEDTVQFEVHFIKKIQDSGKSCLLIKISHAVSDGLGCTLAASNLSQNPTSSTQPQLPIITTYQYLRRHLVLLFLIPLLIKELRYYLTYKNWHLNSSFFTPGPKHTIQFLKDYSAAKIYKKSKELKCSVNDILLATFIRAIQMYQKQTDQEQFSENEYLQILLNMNLRSGNINDCGDLDNYVWLMKSGVQPAQCSSSIFDQLKYVKESTQKLRESNDHVGLYYINKIYHFFASFKMFNLAIAYLNVFKHLTFSNINGPREQLEFAGVKTEKVIFTAVGKDSRIFASMFTSGDNLKIIISNVFLKLDTNHLCLNWESAIDELLKI
eukprot:403358371